MPLSDFDHGPSIEFEPEWSEEVEDEVPAGVGTARRRPAPRRNPVAEYASGASGYAPPASASGRDLQSAVVWGVGFAVVGVVAFLMGPAVTMALVVAILTVCAFEFFNAVRRAGFQPATLLGNVAILLAPLAVYWRGAEAYPLLIALTVMAALGWHLAGADGEARVIESIGVTLLGIGWIGGLGSFAALMLRGPDGVGFLLAAVIATIAYDIGAFAVGRSAGSRPLSEASPNKTVEGHPERGHPERVDPAAGPRPAERPADHPRRPGPGRRRPAALRPHARLRLRPRRRPDLAGRLLGGPRRPGADPALPARPLRPRLRPLAPHAVPHGGRRGGPPWLRWAPGARDGPSPRRGPGGRAPGWGPGWGPGWAPDGAPCPPSRPACRRRPAPPTRRRPGRRLRRPGRGRRHPGPGRAHPVRRRRPSAQLFLVAAPLLGLLPLAVLLLLAAACPGLRSHLLRLLVLWLLLAGGTAFWLGVRPFLR